MSGLLCTLLVALGLAAPAGAQEGQEPGVTQRVFQLPRALDEICTIKEGQTPNVDELKPTIDWSGDAAFGGLSQNFIVHAIADLTVPTTGDYTFRLTSDDGSELLIDDQLVIDHDGLHGAEDKDGSINLTAGAHDLRVNYFEAGGDQVLKLQWRKPGDSGFSVIPTSALMTDTAVRVTNPDMKECEGDIDSPGDGLPLAGVNPAYDLVELRPTGFEPKVTGLEWMGDDLLVLTWGDDDGDPSSVTEAGEVWKLEGVKDAEDPDDVTPTKIAEGLKEPMGIKVVEGDIYISEKHRLTRLVDAGSDGIYEGKDPIATWPFGNNFHEFGFGLLYKDDHFYLNLSVSINLGGASTVPQPAADRGTHIKVNKDTGEIEYVAGGLRTPHGIGWGPEDSIFVTDNQGGWLPANKLIHIEPGKFYNHYTTEPDGTPGRFDGERPTPPALWLPHNEIANSPSQPMLIPSGPFKDQMWVADVTYGGIQRAFLEKIEGQYQGAYFRMTQGLESGITHMLLEDDGSIIVGGLGAGGNWGQAGKRQFGLQKLVPNGTETFDIQKMEIVEGGFELTYTKPLSDAALGELAEKYTVRQWGYSPTSAYGGPKIGEETLTVTDAQASSDRKTVTLQIDGLKPNRVVHVRSPRPFDAQDGSQLLSTEAWYTINKLPGYVPPADGLYELEDGQFTGGAKFDTEHAGYSGTGFVSGFGTVGASVTVDVNAPAAGDYRMALRFTNGPNPFEGPKKISLIVNGESRQITLPSTGAWQAYRFYVDDVELKAGANTVELKHAAGDDGHVNLDALRFAPAGTQQLEAEEAELANGAEVQTEHAGFRGAGYVGGYFRQNATTTFEVTALADGVSEFTLGYANGPHPAPGTKEVSLYVNGEFQKKLALPSTGQWWDYGTFTGTVALRAGINQVSIRYDADDDGNVNLDYLDVEQNEPVQCEPTFDPNDEFDGEQLDRCRWWAVLNEDTSGYSLEDGKLKITTHTGDITGETVSAKNVVLQRAPTDGSWAATTKLSIDGTDDYLQGGIVAHASNTNWAKLVVMQKQGASDEWVIELGRQNGYQNSATLPAGAEDGITLQMFAADGRLRGRYSLDDGATWTEVGTGFGLTGLATPSIGVSAYNGTGSEVAAFERFTVGEPPVEPDNCTPATPEAGYTMLFDGTRASTEDWHMAGPGSIAWASDCTLFTAGGLGLLWHTTPIDHDYSLKLDWKMAGDDNSGVFVGFPDPGDDPWVAVDHGYEIQIDPSDDADSTTGAVYNFQAADAAARDAALNPAGQWNTYELRVEGKRIRVYLNDQLINDFTSTDPERMGTPSFIGLQNHGDGDDVWFRNIQIKDLTAPPLRDSMTTATADPAEVAVGSGSDVTVTVSAEGAAPTGAVELKAGDTVLGSGELVDGEVTIPTGAFDTAGTKTLTASYGGDATTKPSAGEVEITVVADEPEPQLRDSTVTASADPAQVTVGSGSTVTVTVSAQGAAPTGQVQLKAGDAVLGSGALVEGKVALPTGAFATAGTQTLTVAYGGDAVTKPSSGTVAITVVAPPDGGDPGPSGEPPSGGAKPAVSVRGKGKARKADADRKRRTAVIRVRCSTGADACAGSVRLRAGGKTLGTGRFSVAAGANGKIRVKLNRKARKLLAKRKRASATLAIAYGDGRTERIRVRLTR